MKKRYTVLGLSLVLALALAVPAMGGPTNPLASASKSVQSIANQALKKAKAAQKTANAAQSTANSASSTATTANGAAGKAQTTADAASKAATAAQGTANTALTTANAAKAAADAAQASANSAKAIAESKMSGEVHVESTEPGAISFANCPEGKVPTGGGFIVSGANNSSATVTESTQYVNSWVVTAKQINGVAGTSWEVTSTVNCATSP